MKRIRQSVFQETIWRQFVNYLQDLAKKKVTKESFREEDIDQDGTQMIRHSIEEGLPIIVKAKSTDREHLKMAVHALYSADSSE